MAAAPAELEVEVEEEEEPHSSDEEPDLDAHNDVLYLVRRSLRSAAVPISCCHKG